MSYDPKILILSSRFGTGHYMAGEAMAEVSRLLFGGAGEVRHLDYGSFFFKKTDFFIRAAYMKMIKNAPQLWGKLYQHTQDTSVDNKLRAFINGFGHKSLMSYLEKSTPDVIICTHFLPAGVLADFKRKKIIQTPLVSVVTDYIAHGIWIHPDIDLYIVGCQSVYQSLFDRGISTKKISLSGIPVRQRFEKPLRKEEVRRKLGLDTRKKTILLMGGGDGLIGDIKSVQQTILNLKPKLSIQLLVVCGSNRTLYFDFENLAAKSKVLIKSYGYVENIEELMTAADLLITKGGALTITEAMTRALPIIVYKPVPGHESGNASFVENSGAGIIVNSEDGLEKTIEYLLTNQEGLEKMSNSAKKIVPRETAIKAVRRSLEIVTKHNIVAANQSWKTG